MLVNVVVNGASVIRRWPLEDLDKVNSPFTNFDKTAVSFSRATASILLELELISASVIVAAVYASLYSYSVK